MTDKILSVSGDWAVGADDLQWILFRRHKRGTNKWDGLSFVRSTKDILARCMREKGTPLEDAAVLLRELPENFEQEAWKPALQPGPLDSEVKTHYASPPPIVAVPASPQPPRDPARFPIPDDLSIPAWLRR